MNDSSLRSPLLRALGLVITMLGLAPLLVLLRSPASDGALTVMPLAACLLCYPASMLKKRWRICALIILCLLGGALGAYVSKGDFGAKKFLYLLVTFAASAYALPSLFHPRLQYEISIGIAATLIGWLLLRGPSSVAPRAEVFWYAIVYFPLTLIYINLSQLEWERRAQKSSRMDGMRPANIALTCAVIAFSLLLANARAIWLWVRKAINAVIAFVLRLLASPIQQAGQPESEAGGSMLLPTAAGGEQSLFLRIIETLLLAAAVAGAVWCLITMSKRLPAAVNRLLKRIAATLRRYFRSISVEECDYVDVSESLNVGEARVSVKKRRRLRRMPRWDELDNRRRVRAAYRLAVENSAKPYHTATENLTEALGERPEAARQLAKSYDRARYSEHAISDEEADAARRLLKQIS